MKILHTADWHLRDVHQGYDSVQINSFSRPVNIRTLDFFKTIRKMINYAISNKVNHFIIAGDVFDNPEIDAFLKVKFSEHIKKLIANKIKVIIIVGNHDSDGEFNVFSGTPNYLPKDYYLTIIEKPSRCILDDVNYYFVPFHADLENYLKLMQKQLKTYKTKNNNKNILVGHFGVNGGVVGPNEIPLKSNIPLRLLKGYDYVALGDYHINQEVGKNIWYSGSPYRLNMGERERKYFNLIKFGKDEDVVEFNGNDLEVKRVYLKDRNFIKQKIDFETLEQYLEKMKQDEKFDIGREVVQDGDIVCIECEAKGEDINKVENEFISLFYTRFNPLKFSFNWKRVRENKKERSGIETNSERTFDIVREYVNKFPPNGDKETALKEIEEICKKAEA